MFTRLAMRAAAVGLAVCLGAVALAQVKPHAGMMRYPAVSSTHIAFTYAGNLWVVPRAGGVAQPLAGPPGTTALARFSPDGKTVAFVAGYDGGRDIYTVPLEGGAPFRVTHHPAGKWLCGWSPDNRIVFSAGGISGYGPMPAVYAVPATGGMPAKLPVPYGTDAAISPDGRWLAYTPYGTNNATWKRYRGGMSSDIWLFDLQAKKSKRMTDWEGTDALPMWNGATVYFLSDAGKEHKLNIWAYDTAAGKRRQVTTLAEYDVKWPSIGPGPDGKGEIVYQYGSGLFLLSLATGKSQKVEVTIPGTRPTIRTRTVDASRWIEGWSISAGGKRVAVEARGDIWSLPAKNGSPRNMTRTSGVAERDPSWSPDGKSIAYFSDATGEYELYVVAADGKTPARQVTKNGDCYRYSPTWAPDSKKLTYSDKTGALYLVTVETGAVKPLDKDPWGGRLDVSWSSDSKWVTYAKSNTKDRTTAVWICHVASGQARQVTSGALGDGSPVFDRKGEWLYYTSSRSFVPTYEDFGTTWIYRDSQVLLAVPLRNDIVSPYLAKSDEEGADAAKPADAGKKAEPAKPADTPAQPKAADEVSGTWSGTATGDDIPGGTLQFTATLKLAADKTISGVMETPLGSIGVTGVYDPAAHSVRLDIQTPQGAGVVECVISGSTMTGTANVGGSVYKVRADRQGGGAPSEAAPAQAAAKADQPAAKPPTEVKIDLDGFEARAIQLAPRPGRFGRLAVNDRNQLIYVRAATQGASEPPAIKLFDISDEKKEEKTIDAGAGVFDISADGKKLLVVRGQGAAIMDAAPGGKGEPVVTANMNAFIEPRDEWSQLVREAYRIERDFFYDPNMHGVDWKGVYARYAAMLPDAVTRDDVSFIISEMIAELNVGHAYYGGGDTDPSPTRPLPTGLLGADLALENGAYRISKIYRGAPWDSDAVGPLSEPGLKAKEGDYILAVNGVPVDTKRDVWASFVGLAGQVVTLTLSDKPTADKDARDITVRLLAGDRELRYRSWIERNRAYVEKQTGGRVGYIYVPDTGANGQNDLLRQFIGQSGKDALIVDERWNGGGQIPTRFIELLNRPITNYWARRDGNDWPWPPDSAQGPKCMLINGLAGSGGDAFPWYFRQAGLGKLVGTRTWGGLVGMSGNPRLIDGGNVTVPTFAFYEKDGTWGIEGHGVDPDIEVVDDPALMQDGGDPQLDAAIKLMLDELKRKPYVAPKRPAYPNRSGMGIDPKDK